MLTFVFPPHIQAGIASGIYQQVYSNAGIPLSMVRGLDGRFAGHAITAVLDGGNSFLPRLGGDLTGILFDANPISPLLEGFQMLQIHTGFQAAYHRIDAIQAISQSIQNSVGVLQATTALIGVGAVAGVALSAANLYQVLKLREDVKQLRLEVKDGFIDLKQALKDQGAAIMSAIDHVAKDVEFKHHRTILTSAYGHFIQALNWLSNALKISDENARNAQLVGVQAMLYKALAEYNNPEIYIDTSVPGKLRRMECAWVIDRTITLTYQLQGAYEVVSDRLAQLQNKIYKDTLSIIDGCQSEKELDFIFPELTRIRTQDLPVLESWQCQTEWLQALSAEERELLTSSEMIVPEQESKVEETAVVIKPKEQLLYETLKPKSHFHSLRDQLKFIIKPELRQAHELYISQQAPTSGYKALAPFNWEQVPDFTVANLYWYLKDKTHGQPGASHSGRYATSGRI